MAIRIHSTKNLLDVVPAKNEKYGWNVKEDSVVEIIIKRDSILEKVVRVFKKTPKTFTVTLDVFGSFVWNCIDGERNIYEIGEVVKDRFGEEAEPLYERLGGFINLLKNNKFIYITKHKSDDAK